MVPQQAHYAISMQERWDEPGAEHALLDASHPLADVAAEPSRASDSRAKRFFPFSFGSRDCVGQNLARMNYTTTVAMLLAHFNFQLSDEVRALVCECKSFLRSACESKIGLMRLTSYRHSQSHLPDVFDQQHRTPSCMSSRCMQGGLYLGLHCIQHLHLM